MKRFMKGCGITALIFLVVGYVLGVVGGKQAGRDEIERVVESATGGRVKAAPWHWGHWGFYMGSETSASEVDIGSFEEETAGSFATAEWDSGSYEVVRDNDAMFDKDHDIVKGYVSKYCPGEDIQKLDIEVGGCQFYTEPSDDGRIYLEVGNAYRFQGYVEKGTLYIKSKTVSMANWEDSDCWITLYLPEQYWFEDAEIEVGAGYMHFVGLYADKVFLEVGAGQIDICQADVEKLDVTVGAGYIWMTDMQVKKLDAEIGLGGLTMEGSVHEKADLDCSMGNIDLVLAGKEEDFNYKLEGAMGNIDLGDNSYGGLGTEKDINNHASKEIDVECSMGNITISFMDY